MQDEERLQTKIQELRSKYQGEESGQEINRMESEVRGLLREREVLSSKSFKKFAELAEKNVNELSALLSNDDSLLNEKGKELSNERKVWRSMLTAFEISYRDEALSQLESLIDSKL